MYQIFNHLGKRLHVTCSHKIAMQFAGYGYLVLLPVNKAISR